MHPASEFDDSEEKFFRDDGGSTRGFRQLLDIFYDDLTFRSLADLRSRELDWIFHDEIEPLIGNLLQSPLEVATLMFLRTEDYRKAFSIDDIKIYTPGERPTILRQREPSIAIIPQHPVGPYCLDFGTYMRIYGQMIRFDLECDGENFHNTRHDRVRDDFVRSKKYIVRRFSGKEIFQNPRWAVQKFTDEVGRVIGEFRQYNEPN